MVAVKKYYFFLRDHQSGAHCTLHTPIHLKQYETRRLLRNLIWNNGGHKFWAYLISDPLSFPRGPIWVGRGGGVGQSEREGAGHSLHPTDLFPLCAIAQMGQQGAWQAAVRSGPERL